MGSLVKMADAHVLANRLRWKSEVADVAKPTMSDGYFGILCGADLREVPVEKLTVTVNSKLSLQLDCSVDPTMYHAIVAINPKLLEVAEVSAPSMLIPNQGRIRPTIHLRGLKKFDVTDFAWIASIHLID